MFEVNGKRVRGRLYPWGVVEGELSTLWLHSDASGSVFAVENKDHCDFVKLRNMLIR